MKKRNKDTYDMRSGVPDNYVYISSSKVSCLLKEKGIPFLRGFWGFSPMVSGRRVPVIRGLVIKKEYLNEIERFNNFDISIKDLKKEIRGKFPKIPEEDLHKCSERFFDNCIKYGLHKNVKNMPIAAVFSYIRHNYTEYDENFSYGLSKSENLELVAPKIKNIMNKWQK